MIAPIPIVVFGVGKDAAFSNVWVPIGLACNLLGGGIGMVVGGDILIRARKKPKLTTGFGSGLVLRF